MSIAQKLMSVSGAGVVSWDLAFANEPELFGAWSILTYGPVRSSAIFADNIFFKPDGLKMYVIGLSDTIVEYDLSTAWDVSTASQLQTFSVASQETAPNGLFFKPDGTKMYVSGAVGDDVNEYTLSSAWDISTASYVQNFSVSAKETNLEGVFFKPDGLKMYVTGQISDSVHEYALSSAWDISTASFSQSFSMSAQDTAPKDIFFKPDGTKMYMVGGGTEINEYDIATPWDISTASFSATMTFTSSLISSITGIFISQDGERIFLSQASSGGKIVELAPNEQTTIGAAYSGISFSVSSEETNPTGLFFKPDGTKMYVIGSTGDDVNEYTLSSAWDISTASYVQNFSVSSQDTSPSGIFFKPDGTKMYVAGGSGFDINEYDVATPWDVSTASYVRNFSTSSNGGVFFKPDGTKMYAVNTGGNDMDEYTLSTPWNISTASFVQSFAVGASPYSVHISDNGRNMFAIVDAGDVREFILSTPWDISTASLVNLFSVTLQETEPRGLFFRPNGDSFYVVGQTSDTVFLYRRNLYARLSVAAQESSPSGVFFKPDGTKMYAIGTSGDDVNEYTLSTPWDQLTAVYVQNFSVSAKETNPYGIFFKPDGTKMYVIGTSSDSVHEYALSSAWDISTASFSTTTSVSAQDTAPGSLFFKPDGTKMYVLGTTGDDVNEYDLATPWDIQFISYVQNFSVSAKEASPYGIFFKPDGTKMYVVGLSSDSVHEYDVATPWDISTASFAQSFSVKLQSQTPYGIFFRGNGREFFVVSGEAATLGIYKYTISD